MGESEPSAGEVCVSQTSQLRLIGQSCLLHGFSLWFSFVLANVFSEVTDMF